MPVRKTQRQNLVTAPKRNANGFRQYYRPRIPISNRYGYGNYGASQQKIAAEAWKAASADADTDIIYNLPLLRVRSRDLFMGSPILGAAILTLRDNVVGNGLTPIPQVDGDAIGLSAKETARANNLIKTEWSLFADTVECDWCRQNTFGELTDLAFVNMAISGDVLTLLPMKERRGSVYDTRIRLLEADRVDSPDLTVADLDGDTFTNDGVPKVFGGVELTDDGELDAFWIAPHHPLTPKAVPLDPTHYVRVPAFGEETGRPVALLVAEKERPEQRRGVPLAAKCLIELKQLQRYIESTTIQNVIKSYFTAFIETAMPSADMFDRLIQEEDIEDYYPQNGYNVKLGPAIINWMRPGDSVKFPVGAGPEKEFEPYVVALCKFIGACLGVPFEILLKWFSASYSASRAAIIEFWRRVKVLRRRIINQFCQPIYVTWMMEAIAKGVWNAPGFFEDPRIFSAWTKTKWSGSTMGNIDPLKEVQAAELKLRLGLSTLEEECLDLNGGDWRVITSKQSEECFYSTRHGLSYIRNLDTRFTPIQNLGVSEDLVFTEESDDDDDLAA